MLNRLWQAVNICSARRAFALVYAGHAHVVSSDEASNFLTHDFESWRDFSVTAPEHEMVTTISWKIRVPRVIVLLFFDRLTKKEVKFTRHNVFERDKNTCQYCGHIFERNELNLDHVVLIVGGEHGEDGDHAIVRLSDGQSITCQILDREGFELKDAKARAAGGPSREGFELKDREGFEPEPPAAPPASPAGSEPV